MARILGLGNAKVSMPERDFRGVQDRPACLDVPLEILVQLPPGAVSDRIEYNRCNIQRRFDVIMSFKHRLIPP